MLDRKVAITGIGLVNSIGIGYEEYTKNLKNQKIGLTKIEAPLAEYMPLNKIAAINNFDVHNFIKDPKVIKNLNRANQFAVVAAQLALKDSGWFADTTIPDEQKGLYYLNGIGQINETGIKESVEQSILDKQFSYDLFRDKGLKFINPILPIKSLPNIGLWAIAKTFKLKGVNQVVGPFESEGAILLDEAIKSIVNDKATMCLVGGADAPFNVSVLSSLLSVCKNVGFSKHEANLSLGEGAVFLVLEDREHAKQSGKKIYGCIDHCISVNTGSLRWDPEKFKTSYRYMLDKQTTSSCFDVVIPANNGIESMGREEKEVWREYIKEKNQHLEIISFKKTTAYFPASSLFLDVCNLCNIMNNGYRDSQRHLNPKDINGGLACCASLSQGLASVLINNET